jgi:hypothetical protein
MDLQLLTVTIAIIGISVSIGALWRDVLFTRYPRAWTARIFAPEDLEADPEWAEPDDAWVEELDQYIEGEHVVAAMRHIRPGQAWRAMRDGARITRPGPEYSPGTAVAIRESRPVAPAATAAPARHSHRRNRQKTPPAYLRWLDEVDSTIASFDRYRAGALS